MIAFAYAEAGPKNAAMYRALIDGMITSIRDTMPDEEIIMLTDDTTPLVKEVNGVLRIPRTMPIMTWRLKCHQVAHGVAENILFTEPDVRFKANVMGQFSRDFDVAVTTREEEVMLDNEEINTPFTLGMTLSKSDEFWREAKLYCQTLDQKYQDWFGDIMSIAHVVNGGKFNVKKLEGYMFNHVVNDPKEQSNALVLHYKGKRKNFLFDCKKEAA